MKSVLVILFCFLFIGCKRGSTDVQRSIRNSSSGVIHLELDYSSSASDISTDIPPNGVLELYKLTEYADDPENEAIYPAIDIESLIIVNSTGDTLLKRDYKCGCEWQTDITRKRNNGFDYFHKYVFEVINDDFN